jgi:hypothetical protein
MMAPLVTGYWLQGDAFIQDSLHFFFLIVFIPFKGVADDLLFAGEVRVAADAVNRYTFRNRGDPCTGITGYAVLLSLF